jgi:hypothetical protein
LNTLNKHSQRLPMGIIGFAGEVMFPLLSLDVGASRRWLEPFRLNIPKIPLDVFFFTSSSLGSVPEPY